MPSMIRRAVRVAIRVSGTALIMVAATLPSGLTQEAFKTVSDSVGGVFSPGGDFSSARRAAGKLSKVATASNVRHMASSQRDSRLIGPPFRDSIYSPVHLHDSGSIEWLN